MEELPNSIEFEQSLLGAILIAPKGFVEKIVFQLKEEDFYRPEHVKIFKAVVEALQKSETPDIVTVSGYIENFPGKFRYLAKLADSVPNFVNAEYYARKVKELSVRRKIISLGQKISDMGFDNEIDSTGELLLKAQNLLKNVDTGETIKTIGEQFNEILKEYNQEPAPVSTGYSKIDQFSKFSRGDLVLIEGETKNGKTTFAMNILLREIMKKKTAIYLTFEIPVVRFLPLMSRIWTGKIARDKEEGEEYLSKFIAEFGDNLFVLPDKQSFLYLEDFIAKTMSLTLKRPIDFIFVDYDQMVETRKHFEQEERRLSYISRTCKELAMNTNSVVILLSQVNAEGKARWSREKEFYASVVIRLKKNDVNNSLDVWIPYNRYGKSLSEDNAIEFDVNWSTRQVGNYERSEK